MHDAHVQGSRKLVFSYAAAAVLETPASKRKASSVLLDRFSPITTSLPKRRLSSSTQDVRTVTSQRHNESWNFTLRQSESARQYEATCSELEHALATEKHKNAQFEKYLLAALEG